MSKINFSHTHVSPGQRRSRTHSYTQDQYLQIVYWISIFVITILAFESLAVSNAMPAVSKVLNGSSLYTLAFGITSATQLSATAAAGILCDKLGAPLPLKIGGLSFLLGLLAAGFAPNMWILVVGRGLQGIGSGLMVTALYVVVAQIVPSHLQPKYFGSFALAWVLPSLVGPVFTGLMVDYVSWRAIFLVGPVFFVTGVFFTLDKLLFLEKMLLPQANEDARTCTQTPSKRWNKTEKRRLLLGIILSVLTVSAQMLASKEVHLPKDTRLYATGGLILAAFCFAFFFFPRGTFTLQRGLPSAVISRAFLTGPFLAAEIYLPLYLYNHDWSPTAAGVVLTIGSVTWALGSYTQGKITNLGIRHRLNPLLLAVSVSGVFLTAIATTPLLPPFVILFGWAMVSGGIGFVYPYTSVCGMEQADEGKSGQASSDLQVSDNFGSAFFFAITGAISSVVVGSWNIAIPLFVCMMGLAFAILSTHRMEKAPVSK